MAKSPSLVLDAWAELYELLAPSTLWPAHPVTGHVPVVVWGDDVEIFDEAVFVLGEVPVGSQIEWATYGAPSMTERFTLRVFIGSKVPGTKREEAFARLKQLVQVVETALRDQTTGRPAGGFSASVPGVLQWRVARITPRMWVEPDVGHAANADIDIEFVTRI